MQRYDGETSDPRLVTHSPGRPLRTLTPRERQIALLVAEGLKNGAIARQLALSPATVATYVRRIQSRLGLSTRRQIEGWVAERATARHPDVLPD